MVKYALISDIHGNLTALNAVLSDIEKVGADHIICLGDTISKGEHPHECIELVKEKCDAVLLGNNDIKYSRGIDELATTKCDDDSYERYYYNQKHLTAEDIHYLKSLPTCCEFMLSGKLIRCFHASPTSLDKLVIEYSKVEDKLKQFAPCKCTSGEYADIVAFGHTHSASLECLFGRRLINVGSVGNPSNYIMMDKYNSENKHLAKMAQYVIMSGEDGGENAPLNIEFRTVDYDIDAELKTFKFEPDKKMYERELKDGVYRYQDRVNDLLVKLGSGIDKI